MNSSNCDINILNIVTDSCNNIFSNSIPYNTIILSCVCIGTIRGAIIGYNVSNNIINDTTKQMSIEERFINRIGALTLTTTVGCLIGFTVGCYSPIIIPAYLIGYSFEKLQNMFKFKY